MRRLQPSAVALTLVLAVAGCTGTDDGSEDAAPTTTSTTESTTTTTTTTTLTGSSGCGDTVPAPDADRLVRSTIESSGGTRSYLVYVPDSYDPDVPAPVAFVFHGATSNKEQQLAYSDYRPYADEDGALLVLPDALGESTRWSPFGPAFAGVEGVDDLAFFDDLSAAVEDQLCVDPERGPGARSGA